MVSKSTVSERLPTLGRIKVAFCSTRPLQTRGRGSAPLPILGLRLGPTSLLDTPPIVTSQRSRL
eukprot:6622191-Pyramimonas_sp.AAC.1